MRKISYLHVILTVLLIAVLFNVSSGYFELKKRWQIDFEYKPIKIMTAIDGLGKRQNFHYFVYSLENKSDSAIPLGMDVCLKSDMHHPDLVAQGYKPKVKYYQDSFQPLAEEQIIFLEEKLNGLSRTVRKDRIKLLKEKFNYLNLQELREKKEIAPKEKITALAIFENVDPQVKLFEIMVGGLVDVVKRRNNDEELSGETKDSEIEKNLQAARAGRTPSFVYENQIRTIQYLAEGGAFKSFNEVVIAPKWIIRNYGPVGDINSLDIMVKSLSDENPLIRDVSYTLLRRLTGMSYEYNSEEDPVSEANQKSIKLWEEWFYRNKTKLTYNRAMNQFEVVPGK